MPKHRSKSATKSTKADMKKDALALAHLAYDVFKEFKRGGTINNGQNHANQNSGND